MTFVFKYHTVILTLMTLTCSVDAQDRTRTNIFNNDPINMEDLGAPPATSTILLYDCTASHRAKADNPGAFQVFHNNEWWTQLCQEGLIWNQTLCRCEYPNGKRPDRECREYRTITSEPSGQYEQYVNGNWIRRDCSLAVAGLVWDMESCQCVWGPRSKEMITGQGVTPCDIMLNMTFEEGIKDSGKGSFVEVGRGPTVPIYNLDPQDAVDGSRAAYFSETALNIWYFASNEMGTSLRVEFRFKMANDPSSRDKYQIFLSNGCNVSNPGYTTPSLAIGYRPADQSYLLAFETVSARKAIVCTKRLGAYNWHTVSLIYEDGTLLLRVDDQPCIISQDFSGPVQKTPCPLTIGADPLERQSMYKGYLDNLLVARYCRRFIDSDPADVEKKGPMPVETAPNVLLANPNDKSYPDSNSQQNTGKAPNDLRRGISDTKYIQVVGPNMLENTLTNASKGVSESHGAPSNVTPLLSNTLTPNNGNSYAKGAVQKLNNFNQNAQPYKNVGFSKYGSAKNTAQETRLDNNGNGGRVESIHKGDDPSVKLIDVSSPSIIERINLKPEASKTGPADELSKYVGSEFKGVNNGNHNTGADILGLSQNPERQTLSKESGLNAQGDNFNKKTAQDSVKVPNAAPQSQNNNPAISRIQTKDNKLSINTGMPVTREVTMNAFKSTNARTGRPANQRKAQYSENRDDDGNDEYVYHKIVDVTDDLEDDRAGRGHDLHKSVNMNRDNSRSNDDIRKSHQSKDSNTKRKDGVDDNIVHKALRNRNRDQYDVNDNGERDLDDRNNPNLDVLLRHTGNYQGMEGGNQRNYHEIRMEQDNLKKKDWRQAENDGRFRNNEMGSNLDVDDGENSQVNQKSNSEEQRNGDKPKNNHYQKEKIVDDNVFQNKNEMTSGRNRYRTSSMADGNGGHAKGVNRESPPPLIIISQNGNLGYLIESDYSKSQFNRFDDSRKGESKPREDNIERDENYFDEELNEPDSDKKFPITPENKNGNSEVKKVSYHKSLGDRKSQSDVYVSAQSERQDQNIKERIINNSNYKKPTSTQSDYFQDNNAPSKFDQLEDTHGKSKIGTENDRKSSQAPKEQMGNTQTGVNSADILGRTDFQESVRKSDDTPIYHKFVPVTLVTETSDGYSLKRKNLWQPSGILVKGLPRGGKKKVAWYDKSSDAQTGEVTNEAGGRGELGDGLDKRPLVEKQSQVIFPRGKYVDDEDDDDWRAGGQGRLIQGNGMSDQVENGKVVSSDIQDRNNFRYQSGIKSGQGGHDKMISKGDKDYYGQGSSPDSPDDYNYKNSPSKPNSQIISIEGKGSQMDYSKSAGRADAKPNTYYSDKYNISHDNKVLVTETVAPTKKGQEGRVSENDDPVKYNRPKNGDTGGINSPARKQPDELPPHMRYNVNAQRYPKPQRSSGEQQLIADETNTGDDDVRDDDSRNNNNSPQANGATETSSSSIDAPEYDYSDDIRSIELGGYSPAKGDTVFVPKKKPGKEKDANARTDQRIYSQPYHTTEISQETLDHQQTQESDISKQKEISNTGPAVENGQRSKSQTESFKPDSTAQPVSRLKPEKHSKGGESDFPIESDSAEEFPDFVDDAMGWLEAEARHLLPNHGKPHSEDGVDDLRPPSRHMTVDVSKTVQDSHDD